MSDNTSPALASEGTLLQLASGTSPLTWTTVSNVGDINGPGWDSTVVDVTSHSTAAPWRQKIVTLLDVGKMTAKLFWVPTNDTQKNIPGGIRYIYANRVKGLWRLFYTDSAGSYDEFYAYITKLGEVISVAGVYEMTVEFTATAAPVAMT